MTETVECSACSWQGKMSDTDTGHCPECDGECLELDQIYTNGEPTDLHSNFYFCSLSDENQRRAKAMFMDAGIDDDFLYELDTNGKLLSRHKVN